MPSLYAPMSGIPEAELVRALDALDEAVRTVQGELPDRERGRRRTRPPFPADLAPGLPAVPVHSAVQEPSAAPGGFA